MSNPTASVRLWLVIEGPSGAARVIAASPRAPRRGRRVEVSAPVRVLDTKILWLLTRIEPADVVLAVDVEAAPLELRRDQLGKLAPQYQLIQVPILERSTAG